MAPGDRGARDRLPALREDPRPVPGRGRGEAVLATRPRGRAARSLARAAGVAYLVALVGLTALVYGPSERLWPVTLFLFGPRWALAVPLLGLLPLAALTDRRLAALLAVVPLVLAGPLFGFAVPWRAAPAVEGPVLRVVTWNAGGGGRVGETVGLLLELEAPDVVVVQEAGRADVEAPPGWTRHTVGRMLMLTRHPLLEAAARDSKDMERLAGSGAMVRYALETPLGRVDLTSLHLETPREGIEAVLRFGPRAAEELTAKNRQREIEARAARAWVDASPAPLRVAAGDFNAPVESHVFRDHWKGFSDCHSTVGRGFGFTKRTRRIGARIDHVLAGPGLRCVSAHVAPPGSGDHAPVVVALARDPR